MSLYGIGETYNYGFSTYNSSNALTNADSTPTGIIVVNGTDGASVTVTNISTGRYKVAASLAGRTVGDDCYIFISGTVGGVTQHWRSPPFRIAFGAALTNSVSTYGGADTSGTTTLLGRLTGTRATNLDNLDATVSGVPAAVWANGTRTLSAFAFTVTVGTNNDKTGYALTQTFPANFASLGVDSSGRVLLQPTQTGVTIPTVTNLTNLPAAPTDFISAASISTGALNGKGDWATAGSAMTLSTGSITTAVFAAGATLPRVTLADTVTTYTGNTPQTGDAYLRIGAAGAGLTALGDTRIANLDAPVSSVVSQISQFIPVTTAASASTITVGTVISGTYSNTASDDDTRFVLAPTGAGLDFYLTFNIGTNRAPTSAFIQGWWAGISGTGVNVFAYDFSTSSWQQITNTDIWMATRSSENNYSYPLSRENYDSATGNVRVRFMGTSTTTTYRLNLDRVLVANTYDPVGTGGTTVSISPQDIWTYADRTLSSSGVDPVVPPTLDQITAGLLLNPANKLNTDGSGNVVASNIPSDYQQRGVAVTLPANPPSGFLITASYNTAPAWYSSGGGGGGTVDAAAVAAAILVDPDNKLFVNPDGSVIASDEFISFRLKTEDKHTIK